MSGVAVGLPAEAPSDRLGKCANDVPPTGGDGGLHRIGRPWWVRGRAIIGITVLTPFGVASLYSTPWADERSLITMAFECLGWVFLLAGTAVRFWATAYIGSDKEKRLVQDGPYSVCRNPLYFGTFLIALSVAMFLQSGIFAAGVMLAALVYLGPTILFEESCLRGKIGAAYIDYCRRVPRFWPSLAHFHTPPRVSLDVRCLRIESVRALRWAAIPLVAHLVCHFQVLHR